MALAVALAASACGNDGAQSAGPDPDVTTILSSGSAPPSDMTPPGERVVATGLDAPWGLAFLPDGTALVSERDTGRVVALPASGGEPVEVMRLPSETDRDEGGLLGLAVSPDYATDEFVYAYYTSDDANQIVRFKLGEDMQGGDVEVVLDGLAAASTHNGGRIAFGPDGMLYAGVGDAANPSTSQNPDTLNGKILRMTPDGAVPADNPFPDSVVYSLGHRNIQGLAWDSDDRLWATEFGQNTF
nr:PQQ-dependent sugar dehydrogenase [Micromonospora sp. DSM 115978]